jgi:hypothetical protein
MITFVIRARIEIAGMEPTPEREPSALVGAEEAAHVLGTTVAALRKRVQRAQLPHGAVVYVGTRHYMFRRDRLLGR